MRRGSTEERLAEQALNVVPAFERSEASSRLSVACPPVAAGEVRPLFASRSAKRTDRKPPVLEIISDSGSGRKRTGNFLDGMADTCRTANDQIVAVRNASVPARNLAIVQLSHRRHCGETSLSRVKNDGDSFFRHVPHGKVAAGLEPMQIGGRKSGFCPRRLP